MNDIELATRPVTKLKPPSMWTVTMHNDDFTPMEFVVGLLMDVFHKSFTEADTIMLTIHEEGLCVVNLYPKEIALTKASEASKRSEAEGHPLRVTAEQAS